MPLSRDLLTRFLGDEKDLVRAVRNVDRNTKGLGDRADKFGRKFKNAFNVLALGGVAIMASAMFDLGIQMAAMGARFDTVFGDAGSGMIGKLDQLAGRMGIALDRAKGLAAGVGDLLVPLGFSRDAAAEMSLTVLEAAVALKEFTGDQRSVEEIARIAAKSFTGERDSLKELGVVINEADIKTRLLARGTAGLTGQALKQEKALITLELILEQSTDALAAYDEGQTDAEAASSNLKQGIDELKIGLSETVIALAPLVSGFGDLLQGINAVPGGLEVLMVTLGVMKLTTGPIGLAIGALAGVAVAVDNLEAKLDSMVAEANVDRIGAAIGSMGAFARRAGADLAAYTEGLGKLGKAAQDAIDLEGIAASSAAAISMWEATLQDMEGRLSVQELNEELASITLEPLVDEFADAAARVVTVWSELPEKLSSDDVQQAIKDALVLAGVQADFEANMKTLGDAGFGALADKVASNPNRDEALSLMAYFAGDLSAAADFSEGMGLNVDSAADMLIKRLALRSDAMVAAWRTQGAAEARAYKDAFEAGSHITPGGGSDPADDADRNADRGRSPWSLGQ